MNSIDIDVGGTFTDLVLNFDGKALIKKSPTTPYDLSVCFSRVIEDGAAALGMKIEELAAGDRNDPLFDDNCDEPADREKRAAPRFDHYGRPRGRGSDRARSAVD